MSVIDRAVANERPEILIINSYSQSFPWTKFQMEGIQKTFDKAFPDREIPVEFLDWKNYPTQKNLDHFKEQLRLKYSHKHWDVVITTDNVALDMVLDLRRELFPGAWVIFTGINDYHPSQYAKEDRLTGVVEAVDYVKTIDQMLKIHPATKEIAIILDSTDISKNLLQELKRLLPRWEDKVRFTVLHDLPMQQILIRVGELRSDALILITNFTMDSTGEKFTSREAIRLISQHGHVPFYGMWDMQLGYGIVGGWLLDGYLQGKMAAELTKKVLRGETPPIVTESTSRYYLDYQQMERFHIPQSGATSDAILINYPEPIYKKYARHIIIAIVTILTLLVLNIFLIINIRKRHVAELERDRLLVEEKNARLLAEEAGKARETFLTIAAHEFRTPLTVILFQLQLLLKVNRGETKNKSTPEEINSAINMALSQGRKIQQLVEDLLFASRQNSLVGQLHIEEVDLRELITEVLEDLKGTLQHSGSTLDLNFEGPCIGHWERKKIEKLFHNLISNAIKFGNNRPIEIFATSKKEGIKIEIRDHGIGIDSQDRNRIFEKFGRAVSEFNFGGFGLGLYISQKIVEQHKGQITVESGPEKGTVFTVVLPYWSM
ncbi:ATP-binding protein [Peredibacter sp. HCB2-198]|uniref:sensor histidine kinase n=1 Tax=Peredibacter sp. HCB2-198 TaxID=3383025 RepID=UPI0038B5450D